MAVTSKLVLTHVNGNDNVVLLGDGAKFVLVIGDKHTKPFSEADSAALVKELTGIKVAIKKAKLGIGRNIPPADKVVIVVGEDATIDTEVSYQILETVISTKVQDTWPLKVVTENDVIAFPAGVVDDVVKYLLAQGVAKAPTAGMYDKIVFVNALPEEIIEETAAYVLDKAQDDKAAGSAWLNVDGEWMELTDDEEEEGSNAAPAEQTTDNTSTVDPKPAVVPETQTEP
jgi:hypothetical protein